MNCHSTPAFIYECTTANKRYRTAIQQLLFPADTATCAILDLGLFSSADVYCPAIKFVPFSTDPAPSGYRGRTDSSCPKKGRGERSKLRDSDRPLFHSSKPPPPRPICSSPGVSHTSPL